MASCLSSVHPPTNAHSSQRESDPADDNAAAVGDPALGALISNASLIGQPYQVEYSSDLVDWFVLRNLTATLYHEHHRSSPMNSVLHEFTKAPLTPPRMGAPTIV